MDIIGLCGPNFADDDPFTHQLSMHDISVHEVEKKSILYPSNLLIDSPWKIAMHVRILCPVWRDPRYTVIPKSIKLVNFVISGRFLGL